MDVPKQGSGTSNNGNTARKFFKNHEIVSDITGFDSKLLRRLAVILQVMVSSCDIKYDKFEKYAHETAKIFVENYGWYYMPSSFHKILIHGGQVIRSLTFPVGRLREEAAEARNKDFKRVRQSQTYIQQYSFSSRTNTTCL